MEPIRVEQTDERISLDNGLLRLSVARGGCGGWHLSELRRPDSQGGWVAQTAEPAPLWRARCFHEHFVMPDPNSGRRWESRLTEEWFTLDGCSGGESSAVVEQTLNSATMVLRWVGAAPASEGGAGGEPIVVTLRIALDAGSPVSRWTASFENAGVRVGLWELAFPVIGPLRGDAQTRAILPDGWGVEVPHPAAEDKLYVGRYPSGRCVMQLIALTDGAESVYLAAEDPRAFHKELYLTPQAGKGVEYSVAHSPADMGYLRNSYETPFAVAVGVLEGDYPAAARRYREFALTAPWLANGPMATREDVAPWIKEVAIWAQSGTGRGPEAMTRTVRGVRDMAAFIEAPMATHWYSWHEIPFDDHYPEYFPPKEGFKEGVRAMQQAGVRVMPYINGRLWDPRSESWFAEGAADACCKTREGKKYCETYASGVFLAAMCPSTPLWQQKIPSVVERLAGEYGVDAVYIDQIAAAPSNLCFDRTHGHGSGGGDFWVRGYEVLNARAKQLGQAANPSLALTTEDAAEPFTAQIDAFLMCNSTRAGLVPLFPLVYSGYALTFGRYTFRQDMDDPTAFRTKVGQTWLWGAQLGWFSPELLLEPSFATEAGYTKRLARLRADYNGYLGLGQMVAPSAVAGEVPMLRTRWCMMNPDHEFRIEPLVPIEMPAVQGTVWLRQDGMRYGVFLINMADRPLEVAWCAPLGDVQAELAQATVDGATIAAEPDGVGGRVTVPALCGAVLELPRRA